MVKGPVRSDLPENKRLMAHGWPTKSRKLFFAKMKQQDVGIGVCDCVCKRVSASKAVQVSMVYINAAKMLYVY